MPHCIVDCPTTLAQRIGELKLLSIVHDSIDACGLFAPGDIKVRLNGFDHYSCAGRSDDFVHVTLYLFSGRSVEQRRDMASQVVGALIELLPEVQALSMDVQEMARETFVNRRQYQESAR